MTIESLLIANRGEIAIRIARAAAELGRRAVRVYSTDDAGAPHVATTAEAVALPGRGPASYMDGDALIAAAKASACDALHPGYGFLAEDAAFARRCREAGLTFVGPTTAVLEALGDKARARALAQTAGVPVLPGTDGSTSLAQAAAFFDALPAGASVIVKAIAGGGGRGMRVVRDAGALADAFERCRSEALAAFANGDLYVEQALTSARHVEVQIIGDGAGRRTHLWERDCTVQRRHQKIIEIAPSVALPPALRSRIIDAALRIAAAVAHDSLGTIEFLVDASAAGRDDAPFYFIEANPRIQVEHTITEEISGIDLVQAQIRLAGGATLAELGLADGPPDPRGCALQLRINAETMLPDGSVRPEGGVVAAFVPPAGPGLRVDHAVAAGSATNPAFDSLLAKIVVHAADFAQARTRALRALTDLRIDGVRTNATYLRRVLEHPAFLDQSLDTAFTHMHAAQLAAGDETEPPSRQRFAGASIDARDPLAVLDHGRSALTAFGAPGAGTEEDELPDGALALRAPVQGTVIAIQIAPGDVVPGGAPLFVMEAMKMEHVIVAPSGVRVIALGVAVGDVVYRGHVLARFEAAEVAATEGLSDEADDLDRVRPDLAEVLQRHAAGRDASRPDAVARRRKTGQRTARENIDDLCDAGSFVEYGPLVIAAQRRRRPVEELIERTPADGLIAGIGSVNGDLFPPETARCIAMSYDYTVLAGTQGQQNHRKKDRMFELAERWRLPIVFFTEGGGGRPGDTDGVGVAGLDTMAFHYFGRLSGLVPLVGITSGRCFAGNAALLGCCDVVIATEGSNIGMGGPAMVEGGNLGVFRPEEIGPMSVQVPDGVVDIAVKDEAEAVQAARQYLAYFQGALPHGECADQRRLRSIIPENRRRMYDVRAVIETLADSGSVLELRRGFGAGMVTALARVEGRPLGVIANNPSHLAGAIDSDGADKAARFMQLCDAFDLPLLFLCDTPGIMVGPEAEKTALVRHASRMFVTGASVTVPSFTIVLRKAYGLGAQAMAGGSFKAPAFTVSWPTGEFGGMGLEGAVKLGYRNELAAIDDPERRRATFDEMVERMYTHGKAVNTASHFEIDDVIDPMDSRRWIAAGLRAAPAGAPRTGKKRPCIDTW